MIRKVDPCRAEAAVRVILGGYAKDADINAKLVEQGFGPLNPRQIRMLLTVSTAASCEFCVRARKCNMGNKTSGEPSLLPILHLT
jgi:hypothetical protein